MRDKKLTIAIITVLLISVIGLGIAFAAFSQTLTINGTGTVEASKWQVVFEGADGSNTLGAPTLTGTAQVVTAPTIKSNSTEISTYEVTLKSPGDSVTYNFKIHNKGDFAADLTSLIVAGSDRPLAPVTSSKLVTDYSAISSENRTALFNTQYSFYYTSDNILVGHYAARDCLEPGESVDVSLKLIFSSTTETNVNVLPSSELVLDNLGISATYTQTNNGSCQYESGTSLVNEPFRNNDRTYYTYEGKSFIGTGVDNVIISENITSKSKYASAYGIDNGEGANPRYTFADHPAADAAAAYCTGCRLMTLAEARAWAGCTQSISNSYCEDASKFIAYYNGTSVFWWLDAPRNTQMIEGGNIKGYISGTPANSNYGVRPVVSIPSTATMTGSGTKLDPYVITVNNN